MEIYKLSIIVPAFNEGRTIHHILIYLSGSAVTPFGFVFFFIKNQLTTKKIKLMDTL